MQRFQRRNFAGHPFVELLNATAASPAQDVMVRPAGALCMEEAPWLLMRAFLQDADNEAATVELWAWLQGMAKGVKLCEITLTAGSHSTAVDPVDGRVPGTWFEADTVTVVSEATDVAPRMIANGNGLIYLATMEAAYISARCANISTAARVRLLGKPAADLPPAAS